MDNTSLKVDLSHSITIKILPEHSATTMQSGDVEVFATPAMLAFMERCAKELLLPYLEDGQTSVGTHADIKHLAPTAIGNTVLIEAKITNLQGRRVQFWVTAKVNDHLIGEGMHRRVMIDREEFLMHLATKRENDSAT